MKGIMATVFLTFLMSPFLLLPLMVLCMPTTSLLLPQLIPRPSTEEYIKLTGMGITVELDNDCSYCPYTLPNNWKMLDNTQRADLPKFSIVDQDSILRVVIRGVWRGWEDHEIFYDQIYVEPELSPTKPLNDDQLFELITNVVDKFLLTHSSTDKDFDVELSEVVSQAIDQAALEYLTTVLVADTSDIIHSNRSIDNAMPI